jgi:hypothetical protein
MSCQKREIILGLTVLLIYWSQQETVSYTRPSFFRRDAGPERNSRSHRRGAEDAEKTSLHPWWPKPTLCECLFLREFRRSRRYALVTTALHTDRRAARFLIPRLTLRGIELS